MSLCAMKMDELTDVALGGRASKNLCIHLRECRACAAELERQRGLARRIDEAVNALVRSQQAPRLLENITARARSTERPRSRAWSGPVVAALAAIVIGVIFGLHAMQPRMTRSSDVAAWRSPTAVLLESRSSVLDVPLHNVWLDFEPRRSHFKPTPGGAHDT